VTALERPPDLATGGIADDDQLEQLHLSLLFRQ